MQLVVTRLGTLLIVLFSLLSAAGAQQNPQNQFKDVQLAPDSFVVGAPLPAWIDPITVPNAGGSYPVIYRLSDTQILADKVPVVHTHWATQVNDTASLSSVGQFTIAFAPDYQRVQLHAINILRGGERLDRTTTSTIRFLQREEGFENGVYSGLVTAAVVVNDLRVGDSLEVSYSVSGKNPVFGGKFMHLAAWDYSSPTVLRRVTLNHPIDRSIAWRLVGDRALPSVTPRDSTRDGMRKLVFEESSPAPVVAESNLPNEFIAFRFLQFSEFSGWDEIAKWAAGLFTAPAVKSTELMEVVQQLKALPSDQLRVVAALEFVQSQIRYFSVSLGESSHRPTPPELVLKRRYGDCKDKSLLLMTLLNEIGIQARPVLLQIGRRAGLEKMLPSPQFFDHAIVEAVVDGKVYYLDPTRLGQHGQLDRMGQAHELTQILVVAPDTKELSTIRTENNAELFREDLDESASLSKLGGDGEIQIKHVWHGVGAESLRVLVERTPHEEIVRHIGNFLERRYPGAKLAWDPTIEDDRVNNIVSIKATYVVPKFAVERDGFWVVYYKPDNMQGILPSSATAVRSMPLRIPAYPYQAKYTFEMTFPDEVSAVQDPRAVTVENKYFNLNSSVYFRGNLARASIDLTTLKAQIEPEDYAAYSEAARSTDRAIGGFFAIGKQGLKSAETGLELKQRIVRFRQEAIDKITETIKSGKLAGEDLATAYCERSNAFGDFLRYDEALQDAAEALRLAPNSTKVIACQGEAYYASRQFQLSVNQFSKAITLGAINAWEFRMRAQAQFYLGNFDAAAADFAKAWQLADKETKLYCDLWLIPSYQRAGKTVPDELIKRAAAEPRGEWPRPALAMLAGAISPEDMLKFLDDAKKGDDRHMALAEGYFYLGQHYLAKGDRATAKAYFEKTRDLGVIVYTEHVAAGFELDRLKGDGVAKATTTPSSGATAR